MPNSIAVYHSAAAKNRRVSEAFVQGCPGADLYPVTAGYQGGTAVVYGWTRGLWAIVETARRQGQDFYYIDNGYFGRGQYFRVTRNQLQYTGEGARPCGLRRLHTHNLQWKAQRTPFDASHILVACQTDAWYGFVGKGSLKGWLHETEASIRQYTNRPIVVRRKDTDTPLSTHLENCWAVVTHTSNVAVEALVAGVPVFVDPASAAAPVGNTHLKKMEDPWFPDTRLRWAAHLAANQWTLDEVRDGTCWHQLTAADGLPMARLAG